MNKKIDLSISILCIIEIICCFTPFCLDEEYWVYKQSVFYHGEAALERHNGISIFENGATLGRPLAILFVCVAIVVAIIYLIKALDIRIKIAGSAWIFAIIHTAIMVIFLLYSCSSNVDQISCMYKYGINWMSYIIIALNIIILTLAILLKIEKLRIKKQLVAKEQKEFADDLLAYKELLDSGVITQEEFDAKKKQILGG